MPKLPPLPPAPKRPLPAPSRSRAAAIEVRAVEWTDDESSTGKVNATMAVYSSLLSVFDKASPARRTQIVELASECADLTDDEMETVLRVARGLR